MTGPTGAGRRNPEPKDPFVERRRRARRRVARAGRRWAAARRERSAALDDLTAAVADAGLAVDDVSELAGISVIGVYALCSRASVADPPRGFGDSDSRSGWLLPGEQHGTED